MTQTILASMLTGCVIAFVGALWKSRAASGKIRDYKPLPVFDIGQCVRVVLNDWNKTPHKGTIRRIVWHYKDQRYNYYLKENGKKISKRYCDFDLASVAADG